MKLSIHNYEQKILFIISLIFIFSSVYTPAICSEAIRVGVLTPQSGPGGIFGPSSKNCADLAFEEINARGGINGKNVVAIHIDAGIPPAEVTQEVLRLWKSDNIDLFIGMHDGAVRESVRNLLKGQVLYLHPPTFEGGVCDKGMISFGETPQQLLGESIKYFIEKKGAKNWYLIGNDYNWPRASNEIAKKIISKNGGSVVGEEYLPFTVDNFDANITKIKNSKADIVFITLVGGISVNFNRAFASFGLSDNILRVGTLIEENTLSGIGPENSKNLYSIGGYFESINTPGNLEFVKNYYKKFGPDAAVLNHLGEGVYESALFLEAILKKTKSTHIEAIRPQLKGLVYNSPVGVRKYKNGNFIRDIFLMKAVAGKFETEKVFTQMPHNENCN